MRTMRIGVSPMRFVGVRQRGKSLQPIVPSRALPVTVLAGFHYDGLTVILDLETPINRSCRCWDFWFSTTPLMARSLK